MILCKAKHAVVFALGTLVFCGTASGFSIELTLGQDDNLNNGPDGAEQLDSATYALRAARLWTPWRQARAGLDAGLAVQWQQVEAVDGLSWLGLSAQASAWKILGSGLFAPSLTLTTQLGWRDYRSRARDGEFVRADLVLGQRLTTRITGQVQAGWSQRNARYSYYEGDQLSYGAALQWAPSRVVRAFVRHDWRTGDLTVSVPEGDTRFDELGLMYAADDAFRGFRSYRVDSDGQISSLGASWLPNMALAFNLRFTRISSDAARYPAPAGSASMYVYAGDYDRTQTSLSVFYRF